MERGYGDSKHRLIISSGEEEKDGQMYGSIRINKIVEKVPDYIK